ncbi:hypothetical protein ADJ74_09035 [Selenomonas sp. oral taxon 478]|nr:hypothetical protein ADJ74_09035 [Selenomonas sp. oral taxon 478]
MKTSCNFIAIGLLKVKNIDLCQKVHLKHKQEKKTSDINRVLVRVSINAIRFLMSAVPLAI